MQRAIDTGREILNELANSNGNNTNSSSSSSSSSRLTSTSSHSQPYNNNNHTSGSSSTTDDNNQSVLYHILHRLRNLTNTTLSIDSVYHALALAIHVVLLEYFQAVCTGSTDEEQKGPTAGFAAPVREIPRNMLVPNGWIGNDNASFFTRYTVRENKTSSLSSTSFCSSSLSSVSSASSTTIIVALLAAGPHMIVHARSTGVPKKDTSFEIDITRFISSSTPVRIGGGTSSSSSTNYNNTNDNDLTMVNPWYRLLSTAERSKEFIQLIKTHLVDPLVPSNTDSIGITPTSPKNNQNQQIGNNIQPYHKDPLRIDRSPYGGSLMGIPNPLTGNTRGDFDRDLYPDVQHTVPGNLIGNGNNNNNNPSSLILPGNLVGPDHPLFTGGANNGGNFYPIGPNFGNISRTNIPGLPPGARFDPFGPPGIVPSPGFLPPNQNRPKNTPNVFGPNPDHLAPPNFNNDQPPDMYM